MNRKNDASLIFVFVYSVTFLVILSTQLFLSRSQKNLWLMLFALLNRKKKTVKMFGLSKISTLVSQKLPHKQKTRKVSFIETRLKVFTCHTKKAIPFDTKSLFFKIATHTQTHTTFVACLTEKNVVDGFSFNKQQKNLSRCTASHFFRVGTPNIFYLPHKQRRLPIFFWMVIDTCFFSLATHKSMAAEKEEKNVPLNWKCASLSDN